MSSIENKWSEILLKVKEDNNLTNISYESWIKPLKIFTIKNNTIYIIFEDESSDDKIGINFVTKHYKLHILSAISEIMNEDYEIEFITKEEAAALENKKSDTSYNNKGNNSKNNSIVNNTTINQKFTFDNFIVGQNNRFAQQASLAVAESPGENYNPLYIYGGPGLGKTHLMHAIGNFIIDQNPSLKVLYVTSETFTTDIVEGISNKNTSKFRNKYRTVDVLMVDDIQGIIGREATQEEFFNTFNDLRNNNKQIIISSDRPPKELETLDERFKSRFEQGLMADIGYPEYETRVAILKKKQEEQNTSLPDDVINYIAENFKSNVREIEGALNTLILHSRLQKEDINLEIAKSALAKYITPNKAKEITPQLCIEQVAKHFSMTVDYLISDTRRREVSRPRHFAMYICSKLTSCSLDTIGSLLGGKDHTSIIYGINKIEKEYESDTSVKATVDEIIDSIKNC